MIRSLLFSLTPISSGIGNDGNLWALKADERGANQSINISDAVAARGKVTAFGVVQASDKIAKIYLAFAATKPESKSSELYVLDAFEPADLNNAKEKLPDKLIYGTQNDKVTVEALYLVSSIRLRGGRMLKSLLSVSDRQKL